MITKKIKPFIVSALQNALKSTKPVDFTAYASVNTGDKVAYNNGLYVASTSGVTSSLPPTHTSGSALSGTVNFIYIGNTFTEFDIISNLYLGLVKDFSSISQVGEGFENDVKQNLLCLAKLDNSNVRFGLKKNIWQTGNVYTAYSDSNQFNPLFPYYVIADNNVYKCLDNFNNALSTVQPTGKSIYPQHLSDGYVWQYLATVSLTDLANFETTDYFPIDLKRSDDDSEQWILQNLNQTYGVSAFTSPVKSVLTDFDDMVIGDIIGNGENLEIGFLSDLNGSLLQAYPINFGNGYTTGCYVTFKESTALGSGCEVLIDVETDGTLSINSFTSGSGYTGGATVLIMGDGAGAVAEAVIVGGNVVAINLTSVGEGYTWAKGFVIAGDTCAVVKGIITPSNGHGSDILSELAIDTLLINYKITDSIIDYVTTTESFGKVCLLSNVLSSSVQNSKALIGLGHPEYENLTSDLLKYDGKSGKVLGVMDLTSPLTHIASNEESLSFVLKV